MWSSDSKSESFYRDILEARKKTGNRYIIIAAVLVSVVAIITVSEMSNRDICGDFYSHVCVGKGGMDHFGIVANEVNEVVERLREKNDPVFLRSKVFRMYESCMQEDLIEKEGKGPLKNLLDSFGGWPMVRGSSWRGDRNRATEIAGIVTRKFGSDSIFHIVIFPDVLGDFQPILHIGYPHMKKILNGSWRSTRGLMDATIFRLVLNLMDYKDYSGRLTEDIDDMLELGQSIKDVTVKNVIPQPQSMSVGELTIFTGMNWEIFLRNAYSDYSNVTKSSKIIVWNKSVLREICTIIRKFEPRTLVDLVIFREIQPILHHLSSNFLELSNTINTGMDLQRYTQRKDLCARMLMTHLPYAVLKFYAEDYMKPNDLDAVSQVADNILEMYIEELRKNPWLTSDCKRKIIDKVTSIKMDVGFPDVVRNEKLLAILYEKLEISHEHHFENVLNALTVNADLKFSALKDDPRTKLIWKVSPLASAAHYFPLENRLQISAVFLRGVNFTSDSPPALQYGTVGTVVGHEITHALDSFGLNYDKNGIPDENFYTIEGPLMDEESANGFLDKAKCIVSLYEKFCTLFKCVDSNKTFNENLADISGMRMAYLAYLRETRNKTVHDFFEMPEKVKNESLGMQFFYYFAQNWCSSDFCGLSERKEMDVDVLNSPPKFRVLGTLSNSLAFVESCGCSEEKKENDVCQIW